MIQCFTRQVQMELINHYLHIQLKSWYNLTYHSGNQLVSI